jgi:hypothetical protein
MPVVGGLSGSGGVSLLEIGGSEKEKERDNLLLLFHIVHLLGTQDHKSTFLQLNDNSELFFLIKN